MQTRKILRSAVAALLAGAMLTGAVSAENNAADNTKNHVIQQTYGGIAVASISDSFENEIKAYIDSILPQHLAGLGYYGSYTTSDIIPIHNWDGADNQKYLVVVSDSEKMIGSMTVEYVDNNFISLYREENIPELHSVIVSGTSFQLGYKNDCFMLMTNDTVTVIDNPEEVETEFTSALTTNAVGSLNETASYSGSITAANRGRTTTYQVSPTVRNVSNAINPDIYAESGKRTGMCWAACIASVGMQYKNTTGDTALTVYNACKNSTSSNKPSGSGYPAGSSSWYIFAFNEIYGMSITEKTALSSAQVKNLLSANKPIIVRLRNSTDSTLKHAMVLFMYCNIDSTTGQYIFMDPGSISKGAERVSVTIGSTVMNNGSGLTITSRNKYTYDTWKNSIYRK